MELFRRFTIRKAELVTAVLRAVDANRSAKQITLSFRATDDRAEMRAILATDEARELHARLGEALTALNSTMSGFVVYHTPTTGAGYYPTGDEAEGFGGTYRLTEATKFTTEDAAAEVARNYGAIGTENSVLRQAGESL